MKKFKEWQKFVEKEKNGAAAADDDEDLETDKLGLTLEPVDFRYKGEYLQAFQAFYGPKERADPLTPSEIARKEQILTNEIEDAIK